jgi:hypothetical protein
MLCYRFVLNALQMLIPLAGLCHRPASWMGIWRLCDGIAATKIVLLVGGGRYDVPECMHSQPKSPSANAGCTTGGLCCRFKTGTKMLHVDWASTITWARFPKSRPRWDFLLTWTFHDFFSLPTPIPRWNSCIDAPASVSVEGPGFTSQQALPHSHTSAAQWLVVDGREIRGFTPID